MDYYKLKVLNHRKIIIVITIILVILLGGFYYFTYMDNSESNDEIIVEAKDDNIEEKNSQVIYVDIKGSVIKPGVYSFDSHDDVRINDLIIKAGGLKNDADTSLINLSKKIEDEMIVIIYNKSEVNDYVKTRNDLSIKLELCEKELLNKACINKEIVKENNLININTASKEELMTLQGIGENKAMSIIEYRKKTPFSKIEDIKNIDGIGDSLFDAIKENITV